MNNRVLVILLSRNRHEAWLDRDLATLDHYQKNAMLLDVVIVKQALQKILI